MLITADDRTKTFSPEADEISTGQRVRSCFANGAAVSDIIIAKVELIQTKTESKNRSDGGKI
jgi:hypothetical protein